MRFYRHEEVEFTRSSASAMAQNHNFWDVAFGGFYSLAGYNRTNPANPIIGNRAFGTEPDQVCRLGAATIAGLHDHGVLGCGKHFPGHGDTHTDSHVEVTTVHATRARL